jgi:hypothetical protein
MMFLGMSLCASISAHSLSYVLKICISLHTSSMSMGPPGLNKTDCFGLFLSLNSLMSVFSSRSLAFARFPVQIVCELVSEKPGVALSSLFRKAMISIGLSVRRPDPCFLAIPGKIANLISGFGSHPRSDVTLMCDATFKSDESPLNVGFSLANVYEQSFVPCDDSSGSSAGHGSTLSHEFVGLMDMDNPPMDNIFGTENAPYHARHAWVGQSCREVRDKWLIIMMSLVNVCSYTFPQIIPSYVLIDVFNRYLLHPRVSSSFAINFPLGRTSERDTERALFIVSAIPRFFVVYVEEITFAMCCAFVLFENILSNLVTSAA